jgi:hypothetical protein
LIGIRAALAVLIASIGGIWFLSRETERHADAANRALQEKAAAEEHSARRAACSASVSGQIADYDKLMRAREFGRASATIRECATVLDDTVLKGKLAAAEFEDRLAIARDRTALPEAREIAMTAIERDYPEHARASKLGHLRVEIDKAMKVVRDRDTAAAAAVARSKPALIGMSREEVLASIWGKPDSVNRTTYSWGTHEQWVYGTGRYLYFRNGRLESIQD